ncbi:hypothetical protein FB45DRAFT_1024818 [Roridomyces roridus]|uniref:Uncharacterized protein n=1 Tax=Roridomyces roridus TaxID=1738132 RepID=A0AAD7FPX6_9AGAR|nr:hypothetical protein FB45DRAFT_1024818 [Roridomyces roridus]
MPRLSARQARVTKLLRLYFQFHKARVKRRVRLKNKRRRMLARAGYTDREQHLALDDSSLLNSIPSIQLQYSSESDSGSLSSSLDFDSDSSETTSSSSDAGWSEVLGTDWRSSGSESSDVSSSSDSSTDSESNDSDIEMPELLGYLADDDAESDDKDSDDESLSDDDDSDKVSSASEPNPDLGIPRRNAPWRWVRESVEDMYAQRYEQPRNTLPRTIGQLTHVLTKLKVLRPDLFRQELRVSPYTFDRLVEALSDDPVFTNNSRNGQMPVETQVAIALFRFGHSGNAAGLQKVANWAGVGKGTVLLVTRRVLTAILRREFMENAVRMPTAAEKEKAKEWVEAHSCKAWRNGWCLVDGTLVPLFDRPYWYGESYFDRKCNYSLNVQVSLAIE